MADMQDDTFSEPSSVDWATAVTKEVAETDGRQ